MSDDTRGIHLVDLEFAPNAPNRRADVRWWLYWMVGGRPGDWFEWMMFPVVLVFTAAICPLPAMLLRLWWSFRKQFWIGLIYCLAISAGSWIALLISLYLLINFS